MGETVEEVERLMQEALAFHIDGLRAEGLPVPKPRSSVRFMAV